MATDVDVQFFSHLNGLVLGNNWGDMIRLLDACLVNGVTLPSVTSASIDEQGDVHLTLFAPHKALLLQVVELTDFEPLSLNQKYRIKGVPSPTQLILKPQNVIAETAVTTKGTGKLASLGYDIIFRDANDVKRVYRAKNPTSQHPFIRVDESLTSPDGTSGIYSSSYAKYAMVGLLEHMDHIDDYEDPHKLQLPLDTANLKKNWQIAGTGTSVSRGWSKWYWAARYNMESWIQDTELAVAGSRQFTLVGTADAFYMQICPVTGSGGKRLYGCGLYEKNDNEQVTPPWFLMTLQSINTAGQAIAVSSLAGSLSLAGNLNLSQFFVPALNVSALSSSIKATPLLPNFSSGLSNIFSGQTLSALQIPFYDSQAKLRGNLKNILYAGQKRLNYTTTPLLSGHSMYVYESSLVSENANPTSLGGFYYYLGDLE